ncbi:MAG: hypothetical protein ABR991_03500, partial [Terracidiphilus sp.]
MRRFLALICLLFLAIPAGISISGCTRDPGANYCNGQGYGMKIGQVTKITLSPATTGISLAYGQTQQISSPQISDCKGNATNSGTVVYGTSNNQLVDIAPNGNMCAGTWNRNSGGGIANYTICSPPNPMPSTGGLPYASAYITATEESVVSNPVEIYVHPPVTAVSLVTTPLSTSGQTGQQCYSNGQTATLDAQACITGSNNQKYLLCAPASVTSANAACPMPGVTPDIIASGSFGGFGGIATGAYTSGGSIAGSAGQTCTLGGFNNGLTGASATVTLTGANTIANGTSLLVTAGGAGAASAPTTATLSNGTATCSGTATITSTITSGTIVGLPKIGDTQAQTCNLTTFNNGSTGATATVELTGVNTIASGTPLLITAGGVDATAPPTTAFLSSGTAACSGIVTVSTALTQVPNCTAAIGTLSYSPGNTSVASIPLTNTTSNQVIITAGLPGTTVINASVAGSGSTAGYFSTCPPKSISLTLENGDTAGTITKGVTQNLKITVYDTQGNTINGPSLDFQSTDPIDISISSGGSITTSFPGVASVYAICQPSSCNPSPIDQIGLFGTGLPITSNPVTITTQGEASDYLWFGAPGQSQYIFPVDLLSGTAGSSTRLPYVPNSMVMDRLGNNIYFGSPHELMVFTTSTSSVSTQNTGVPGVVLAVSPDGSTLLINDQQRQLFYLYTPSGGSPATFGGMGAAASWTPDAKTLYIADSAALNNTPENVAAGITGHTDTLYVYNQNTGWTTEALPCSTCSQPNRGATSLAITIPSVGAFLSGAETSAHTWCPTGTAGDYSSLSFYPQSDFVENSSHNAVPTDVLAATTDGQHILGAAFDTATQEVTLSDIGISVPSTASPSGILTPNACPSTTNSSTGVQTLQALSTDPWLNTAAPLVLDSTKVDATRVNQVVVGSIPQAGSSAAPPPNLAFITYSADETNTKSQLPYYLPDSNATSSSPQQGTLGYIQLTAPASGTAPTAPLTGVFTPDQTLFFVSTAGDNMIHVISIPPAVSSAKPPTDTKQFSPNLPACSPASDLGCVYSGNDAIVPATVITVKPRKTT